MRDPWFPVVCLLIVMIGVWLGIFGPLPSGVTNWVHHWQTLIAAVVAATIASIAAYVAFQNTERTLKHNEHLERHRRARKHASLRAMLPLALSKISEYAEDSADALNRLVDQCQNETLPKHTPFADLPVELPSDTLEILTDLIEYSDDLNVSVLEATVAWIQIHDARVRGMMRDNDDPNALNMVRRIQLEGSIIDAASIYAAAGTYYDFGRQLTANPPNTVTWDNVRNALRNMRFWDQDHPRIYKIIEGREKDSAGPFTRLNKPVVP